MSATVNPDNILQTRGVQRGLDAWVVAAAFSRDGACAFATGDGRILIARKGVAEWQEIAAHDGGVSASTNRRERRQHWPNRFMP